MQVKCPKCRYRYETEVGQGLRELSCVCPRCGTPFSVIVTSDETSSSPYSSDHSNHSSKERSAESSEIVVDPLKDRLPHTQKPSSGPSKTVVDKANNGTSQFDGGTDHPSTPPRYRHQGGCCSLTGCFFLIFILVLLWAFHDKQNVESETSYKSEETSVQTEAVESTPPLDSIHTQVTEKDAKPTPDWVFGTWQVETEYGIIEVRVAGKWLRETSAGGTCHSTFFYSKGQLNCDFPDRHRTVRSYYRLDEVHHRIDAGEGLWMKKISDR